MQFKGEYFLAYIYLYLFLPIYIMAYSWNKFGKYHQILPVWFTVTRYSYHVTIGPAISLQ